MYFVDGLQREGLYGHAEVSRDHNNLNVTQLIRDLVSLNHPIDLAQLP